MRLGRVADRLVAHPFQAWFYGDSIGFEGLLAASELLGEARYADFVHGFLRGWAARERPYRPDDNTAPGHVLCALAERTGDERPAILNDELLWRPRPEAEPLWIAIPALFDEAAS